MKVRELIDKLSDLAVEHEDADIYVLGECEDDDRMTWYKLANKVEFDTDGIYITYDYTLAKDLKIKKLEELRNKLEENNNQCLSLCILTDMDEMSELVEESKKIRDMISVLEFELGGK